MKVDRLSDAVLCSIIHKKHKVEEIRGRRTFDFMQKSLDMSRSNSSVRLLFKRSNGLVQRRQRQDVAFGGGHF